MTREEFEKIVEEEFPAAVPEKFHHLIRNVAFLVEDEPDAQTRREHDLLQGETLLGLYRGVPHPARGEAYGVGTTLPDTITLYFAPLQEEAIAIQRAAAEMLVTKYGLSTGGKDDPFDFEHAMRRAVRETIWHEVAHYFGMDEDQVHRREHARDHGPDEACDRCSA